MNAITQSKNTPNNNPIQLVGYHELIGQYALEAIGEQVSKLLFLGNNTHNIKTQAANPLLIEAEKQVEAYLDGKLINFDLPFILRGTDFQQLVWKALANIPYGTVCCYKDIAENIGNPKAVRAVGGANNKNPLPLFFPCHRVIGKNNKLVGYAGGLEVKRNLLVLEGYPL